MIETEQDRQSTLKTFGSQVKIIGTTCEKSVYAIYDHVSFEVDAGMSMGISSFTPKFTVSSKDFVGFDQQDIIDQDGIEFVITDVQPDGLGMTVLSVHKAQS